ncbi:MAG: hypothetical protein ABL903_04680 [Methylococcales bacterium]
MLTFLLRFALIGFGNLLLPTLCHATEPMTVPVFVKYGLMQQVMLREMFKGPGHTAIYRIDGSGCNTVNFANPQLSGIDGLMQVRANVLVKLGISAGEKKCTNLKHWSGRTVVQGKPLISGADALAVHFKVSNAEVFDANGKQLNNRLVKAALEGQLHPLLDRFKMDLKPNLQQLKSVLPFMLPGYSAAQIDQLIASVHLGNIQVQNNGLNIAVQMAVDKQSMLNFLPK